MGNDQIRNAVPVSPTCEILCVADLGRVRFHGRINGNDIAAEGLPAINAEDDAPAQERLLNPPKTAVAIILHGAPLLVRLLLIVDVRLSTNSTAGRKKRAGLA